MSIAARIALPAYVLLCLILGGSTQGIWGNAFLQLIAIAIIVWSAVDRDRQPLTRPALVLLAIIAGGFLWILAQLVPLPSSIWTGIPGRAAVGEGFGLLGVPLPWIATSLAPYVTAATALTLLPPLAVLLAMLRLRYWSSGWMFVAILVGATISILLGMLQVGGNGDSWYFYQRTNLGIAVGTFANGNHFATLIMVAAPLVAALTAARWRSASQKSQRSLTLTLGLSAIAVLVIGIFLNRSMAMVLIGPPVFLASAILAFRLPREKVRLGFAAIGLLLASAAGLIGFAGKQLPGWGTEASLESRSTYWSTSLDVIEDHWLTGSGFGTFEQVYRGYEDPAAVDRWYVNHAHNDYLEIALEGGTPAIVLVVLFLWWWMARAREAWRSPDDLEVKAATIASAAILLHSAFDYPLRTAGLAVVFAACLALMAGARGRAVETLLDEADRPRHATL